MSIEKDKITQAYTAGPMFESWVRMQELGLWPIEKTLLETHCPDRSLSVCNIGCGSGRETFAMHQMGWHNICGVDCTEALLNVAREKSLKDGLAIRFELTTADHLPFADGSLDVVTLFENIYGHITPHAARLASLKEISRVLKPQGVVLMVVTSLYHTGLGFLYVRLCDMMRVVWNPSGMEPGDKRLQRSHWGENVTRINAPCSHWFARGEVSRDAASAGLSVKQRSAVKRLLMDPLDNTQQKLRGMGRLVYVLAKG